MSTEDFSLNLWVEISEEQAEKLSGGFSQGESELEVVGSKNPGGKRRRKGKGKKNRKGKGKGKRNCEAIVEISEPSGKFS